MSEIPEIGKTERGFDFYSFTDANGERCTLQKSSSGNDELVWLGVEGKVLRSSGIEGVGMIPVPLNEEFLVIARMHLNREMARKLLPMLQNFVEIGEMFRPDVDEKVDSKTDDQKEESSETKRKRTQEPESEDVQPTQPYDAD